MNSDLSREMADSALAVGNNKNKRYPWAFVYMNIVAKALVQNINHAGNGKQMSRTQQLIQMARYQLCLAAAHCVLGTPVLMKHLVRRL